MSGLSSLLLGLAYVLPLALVALLLGRDRRPPHWLIIVVLLTLPVFYVTHYTMLQALQGWPADTPPPATFRLLGFDIREPDTANQRPGEILIWAQAADAESPRVHRLPYSRELHDRLNGAAQRQAQGRTQAGRRVSPQASDSPKTTQGDGVSLEFRDEKPLSLPAKGTSP